MRDEFQNLMSEVLSCTRCGLSQTRNHVIFGEGHSKYNAKMNHPEKKLGFWAGLGAFSRRDQLKPDDFKMLVTAEK